VVRSWLLVIACVIIIVGLAVNLYFAVRRTWRANQEWRAAQARRLWADAREELFALLVAGSVDAQSRTFQALYHMQSFVLQHQDDYHAVADELRRTLFSPVRGGVAPWVEEETQWPAAMASVLAKMSTGALALAASNPSLIAAGVRLALRPAKPWLVQRPPVAGPSRVPSVVAGRIEYDLIEAGWQLEAIARRMEQSPLSLVS
jgi:hypothetical protein